MSIMFTRLGKLRLNFQGVIKKELSDSCPLIYLLVRD